MSQPDINPPVLPVSGNLSTLLPALMNAAVFCPQWGVAPGLWWGLVRFPLLAVSPHFLWSWGWAVYTACWCEDCSLTVSIGPWSIKFQRQNIVENICWTLLLKVKNYFWIYFLIAYCLCYNLYTYILIMEIYYGFWWQDILLDINTVDSVSGNPQIICLKHITYLLNRCYVLHTLLGIDYFRHSL